MGIKPVVTTMDLSVKLCVDQGKLLPNSDSYWRLVGKLNYLTITRSDILFYFAVTVINQFMYAPCSTHIETTLGIVRYLKTYPGRTLFYEVNDHLHVEAFTYFWLG